MVLKLKINTGQSSQPPSAPPEASAVTPSTKLKLTSKFSTTPQSAKPPGSAKSAGTGKKRSRDDADEGQGPSSQKPAPYANQKKIKLQTAGLAGPQVIKLKRGSLTSPATPMSATKLKIKTKGKPMHRPLGVGYDSEAEEAEEDPAIEENFVLRMAPGPDCDYLRRAIEERKIGIPVSSGGADVHMRFFARDGRRAAIVIQGRVYAAILVDLPCIIETMKSWDKKGWWKSADICQMLLVLGRVTREEDARDYKLPPELDHKTWQYPHGLTPPLQNVRKRRFRKRVSHRTIEAAEAEVERQLALDDQAYGQRGEVILEDLDLEDLNREGDDDEDMDDQDAEGEADDDMFDNADAQDDDQAALLAELEGQLAQDEEEDEDGDAAETTIVLENDVPITPAAAAAAGEQAAVLSPSGEMSAVEAASASPAGAQTSAVEDDEDDEDDDEDDDDEQDEESRERAAELAEKRATIKDLERQLQETLMQKQRMGNPILRARFDARIKALEQDLQIKKRDIGDFDEDDDF